MRLLHVLLFAAIAAPASASDDHEAAREALQNHKIQPLAETVRHVEKRLGARMIEAELERERGSYFYELEMITEAGRMIEVRVEAATGEIVEVEQEGWSEEKD